MVGEAQSTAVELGVKTANVASFLALSKFFNLIVSGVAFVTVARLLGASSYGVYVLALGIAGLVGAFSTFSAGSYFTKYIPEFVHKGQKEKLALALGDGLALVTFIGIVFTIIGILVSGIIAHYVFHGAASSFIVDVAMLSILFYAIQLMLMGVLVGMGDGKGYALQTVAQIGTQGILGVGLVLLGVGPLGAVIGWVAGFAAGAISGLYFVMKRSRITVEFGSFIRRSRQIIGFSVPVTLAGIASSLVSNWSVILLGLLFLPNVVGAYGVGNKIGSFMDVVTGSVLTAITPMFAAAVINKKLKGKVSSLYSYSMYFGLAAITPIVIYFVLLSNAFVVTVLASTYSNAALYMSLISVGVLITFFWQYGYSVAIGFGDVKRLLKYTIIMGVVEVIFLQLLVPRFGALGVIASVYFIGPIVAAVMIWNYMHRIRHFSLDMGPLLRLIPANVVLLVLFYALATVQVRPLYLLIVGLGVLAFVYPPLLAVTKGIGKEQLSLIRKIANSMPMLNTAILLMLRYTQAFVW